jgi:pimeloyl-ACP methyl ester carboxylesterase
MKNNLPPKIFLLIGLTRESKHWDDTFVNSLKEKFKTDDIVGLDIPGAGTRLSEKTPVTMKAIVKSMRKFYAHELATDQEKILITASLGGMIGATWLDLFRADFDRFVIINSSFGNFSPVHKRVQPSSIKDFFKVFFAKGNDDKENKTLSLCANSNDAIKRTLPKWIEIAKTRPLAKENILRQLAAGATCRVQFEPQIPVLIVASKFDRLAHYSCSQEIHSRWPMSTLHLCDDPKIGHAYHIDAPAKLADTIVEWVG